MALRKVPEGYSMELQTKTAGMRVALIEQDGGLYRWHAHEGTVSTNLPTVVQLIMLNEEIPIRTEIVHLS